MYQRRSYRNLFSSELVMFDVCIGETDLHIGCTKDLTKTAISAVRRARSIISNHMDKHPAFAASLEPLEQDASYPVLIQKMTGAGAAAGTGPMAAVAGAIAQFVGEVLSRESDQVFVENGGDIFMVSSKERTIGIFAGSSPLSNRIAIRLRADRFPLGICTSSGTVGHSLSFGKADAVTVVSGNAALADAVATAAGNLVKKQTDIDEALKFAMGISGVEGLVIIAGDKIGVAGDIELAKVWNQV